METTATRIGDRRQPSPRTVLRWIARWQDSGRSLDALVPQTALCGNFRDKLHPTARDLLNRIVEEFYLMDSGATGVSVHAHVKTAFRKHNRPLPAEDRLPVPSLNAIYRVIGQIDRYTLDFTRTGKRTANHKWRAVGSGSIASCHNEVWEIDHTQVDCIAIDDTTGLPICRPWVTVVLDVHTRMVVGFFLSFEAPSVSVVMQCLRNAVGIKEPMMEKHPELSIPWPCFGIPRTIVPDQGREFKSKAFVDACLLLGIEVSYTPVLKPWYKGKIERFLGNLSRSVFHRVPGTTFSNIFERRKEVPPETVAVATLDELRFHTLNWITQVYHKKTHRTLATSPLAAWSQSVATHGVRPPPNPDRLAEILSPVEYRAPQRQGIEFEGLLYNSSELASFRIRPNRPRIVKISPFLDDLTRMRWWDPDDGTCKIANIQPSMRAAVAGRTLEMHKLARAIQRENSKDFSGEDGLVDAYTLVDDAMRKKTGASGKENRRKAAIHWEAARNGRKATEYVPAFDPVRSARSIADEIEDGEESAPPQPTAATLLAREEGDLDDVIRKLGLNVSKDEPEQ